MHQDAALPTQHLGAGTVIAQAEVSRGEQVTLDSPALDVMTDLTRVRAATTAPTTTLAEAERIMIAQGVRMLFVVSSMPAIEGLVTLTDLHGDRQMRLVQQRQLRYDELTVADVMASLEALEAIEFADIRAARVSNLVATLKRHGRNHLLVVEAAHAGSPRRVRGVISRAQLERQLGAAIAMTEVASTFAEIGRMLS